MSDFEVMFFAIVAVFFAVKLWQVFGKTTGDEKARAESKIIDAANYAEKLKAAAQSAKDDGKPVMLKPVDALKVEEEIPEDLKAGVNDARKIDPAFSLKKFNEGAVQAFEIVVRGFAEKKRDALKFLLSGDVYQDFNTVIESREKQELVAGTTVVSIDAAEILNIEIKENICHIVVKFVSEQIHFLKNKAGEIIEGSKNQIDRVTDIWTFERNLTSKKPNWTIVGVQAA